MPFSLTAIVGTATYSLTAGTPFRLDSAEGLGMATVRRLTEQTPFGDGDTDLGYRLNSRYVTLSLSYSGTSGSVVDGYRNTLATIFKPSSTVPVQLRVVRDDGGTRQLDCYTVGQVDVPLDYEYVPGNLERTVVQLKAADPTWYSPAPGTSTITGTATVTQSWWLGAVNGVYESGAFPVDSQAWTSTFPAGTPEAITIAIRTAGTTAGTPVLASNLSIWATNEQVTTETALFLGPRSQGGSVYMSPVLSPVTNYFFTYTKTYSKLVKKAYVGTIPYGGFYTGNSDDWAGNIFAGSFTTDKKWRVGWAPDIRLYAVLPGYMTDQQIKVLDKAMAAADGGTVIFTVAVPYSGNVVEYPVIKITGPIDRPVVTHNVTGDTLSFGTHSIGSGDVYTIDLRYGRKSVTDSGGTSRLNQLTADSDLATFALLPSPQTAGGTNYLTMAGTNGFSVTQLQVIYYNRYSEY